MAFGLTALQFAWQGLMGFSLWDEGFLWYGVQRTLLGEVPVRDFMSYDPGRYYLSALFLHLIGGNGIVPLRVFLALLQALGIGTALLLLHRRPGWNAAFSLCLAVLLAFWMFPPHKIYDILCTIALVAALAGFLTASGPRRGFLLGLTVGLLAVVGCNHGVYGLAASLPALLGAALQQRRELPVFRTGALWAAGIVVGYLPALGLAALVPGYAAAYVQALLYLFSGGGTNFALPVPWPWLAWSTVQPWGEALRALCVGLFFLALPAFAAGGLLWGLVQCIRQRPLPPLLTATALGSLVYSHHAFSRADVNHLAQAAVPLLLGVMALLAAWRAPLRYAALGLFCAAALVVMLPQHPGWQSRHGDWQPAQVGRDTLVVQPAVARDLALLQGLAERFAPDGCSVIAVPYWPGAYAVLERRAPLWENYALRAPGEAFEREEIRRLEAAAPCVAVINDLALDGKAGMQFAVTHPLLDAWIRERFVPLPVGAGFDVDPLYRVYVAPHALP